MQTFSIRRPAVRSPHGLVAAQNRHAAEAGAAVLARGGNAMDAAIVTALVLSIVEPWLSGVGGGGFLIHADGRTGALDTLDFVRRVAATGFIPSRLPASHSCFSMTWKPCQVSPGPRASGRASMATSRFTALSVEQSEAPLAQKDPAIGSMRS